MQSGPSGPKDRLLRALLALVSGKRNREESRGALTVGPATIDIHSVIYMADYPKLLLAGALILVSAGTASAQQDRAAGDKDSMLAFVSERDGNSEIYVMNMDGTGLLRLTNHPGRDTDPAWSPDGKRIAFASDREGSSDIYVMNADGSNLVRRTQTGSSDAPAWSPDGSKIAFSSLRDGQFGIYVMSVDGDWANPTRVGYDRG